MRRARVSLIAFGFALVSLVGGGAQVLAQEAARSVVDRVRSRGEEEFDRELDAERMREGAEDKANEAKEPEQISLG